MKILDQVPKPRVGLKLAEMGGESLLYCHETLTMVYLNDSAAAIWRLLNGERTVGEIVELLTGAYPSAAGDIGDDVHETIKWFRREGVLTFG